MPFSVKHNLLFVHIPKCAGTTIEVALKKHASPSSGSEIAKQNKWWRNKRLFELYSENPCYFKFSFTRNPFERIVSAFSFFTNNNISFKNFVLEIELFFLLEMLARKIRCTQLSLSWRLSCPQSMAV